MDFEDFGAKTTRKVRIGAIVACKVLLEAIFGARFGGMGALVSLLGKMWGNIRGKSTPKCGANLPQNLGQNLWQSHDSSRRRNPENRWKSWKVIEFEIVFLFSHLASSVVPRWKMGDFGRVEVAGLAGGWLAGRAGPSI